jgi:hypothetical protein
MSRLENSSSRIHSNAPIQGDEMSGADDDEFLREAESSTIIVS